MLQRFSENNTLVILACTQSQWFEEEYRTRLIWYRNPGGGSVHILLTWPALTSEGIKQCERKSIQSINKETRKGENTACKVLITAFALRARSRGTVRIVTPTRFFQLLTLLLFHWNWPIHDKGSVKKKNITKPQQRPWEQLTECLISKWIRIWVADLCLKTCKSLACYLLTHWSMQANPMLISQPSLFNMRIYIPSSSH